MTVTQQSPEQARKSAWIPWVFVGGMGVVVAVNAVMITFAISTFSGISVEKPYERGVAYNRVLEAQARQDALGWTFGTTFQPAGGQLDGRLVLTAHGPDGAPLDGLVLDARLVRPVEKTVPIELAFTAAGDGRYIARAELPMPGQWDLKLHARRGDDLYTLIERLDVR